MNTKVLPAVLTEILEKKYSLHMINNIQDFSFDKKNICLFPHDYFSPKNYVSKKIRLTKNTYSVHHFAGTWQPWWKKLLLYFWVPFSIKFPYIAKKIKGNILQ